LFAAGINVVHLRYQTISGRLQIKMWKDLRDEGVEKQNLDISCGSAATATILRSFYRLDVSKLDIFSTIIRGDIERTSLTETAKSFVLKIILSEFNKTSSFQDILDILVGAIQSGLDETSVPGVRRPFG